MTTPLKDLRFRRSATDEGDTEMGGSGGFAPMSGSRPQSQFYEASQSTRQRASAQSASGVEVS